MAELHPVMNNTKWRELRVAIYAIGSRTTYRIMRINGYYSDPDAANMRNITRDFGLSVV
jgi:hypothetical protein